MLNFKHLKSFIFLLLFVSSPGLAIEKILDYRSDVKIHVDGSLLVTETIKVNAEGNQIRRGIYRDFPTTYKDKGGNRYKVAFEVISVQRNYQPEDFHTENLSNGVRLYMGSSSTFLASGVYTYTLQFRTTRQIGFFDGYDELYWNVTGLGWMFSIDHASVRIELPASVDTSDFRLAFYTGSSGSIAQNARSVIISDKVVEFETTSALGPYEGLTVAVGWPKGLVTAPDQLQKIRWFLQDNGSALALLIGFLAALAWYVWAWRRYGRDPEKGTIIPLFEPPKGISAAGCSYIRKLGFAKQTFPAAIISLGVKGYLEIHEDKKDFELSNSQIKKGGKRLPLSKGEQKVYDEIFKSHTKIKLEQKNHPTFTKAKGALLAALKAEHKGRLFNINGKYAIPAVLISFATLAIAAQFEGGPLPWIVFVLLSLVMHITFIALLRAPTPAGRKIMDQIEGFKMYLNTAEQDRLDRMKSPTLTPEVFETFLPYAFALGVENNWCDRFTREFPAEISDDNGYRPGWYVGRFHNMDTFNHLGNNFSSSFSSAVSSSSTPPGSSSGSGGGGSSGGGGGGGGGGGW
jgi:uncharacterized membrane protein YgcG